MLALLLPFAIPSPSQGVWHVGPVPIRGYALCILVGIVVAVWLTERRWSAQGGRPGVVGDIALWAVPFGIVGGRLYHVATDPELYFGVGRNPWAAFFIWQGGLGIWGAIALGGLGAWLACRRYDVRFADLADAAAPAIPLAQAIGRWGNWFNQELFGRPTRLPWGLRIDPAHRPAGFSDQVTYQPTFLYESVWDVGTAFLVLWVGRRFRLTNGRLFAVYVMAYTTGRIWIESVRIDTAHHLLGLRLNIWTSALVFVAALTYFVLAGRRQSAAVPADAPVLDRP